MNSARRLFVLFSAIVLLWMLPAFPQEKPSGTTAPKVIATANPTYTEAARAAKFQGVVVVQITVDNTGNIRDPKVIRGVGYGLDEKAIEAVQKWKFKPATRDGVPVPATLNVEVLFRLDAATPANDHPKVTIDADSAQPRPSGKPRWEGTVQLEALVDKNGTVKSVKVIRSQGKGLDEKAIEQVKKWKFPTVTWANGIVHVDVNFKLY
jgi:TonB family protein